MDLENLSKWHDEQGKEVQSLANRIYKEGIYKACLNMDLVKKTKYKFNLEIPETKIFNQRNSYQCPIYAFNRFLQSYIIKYNKDYKDIYLSHNYIDFYDKYEKIKALYEDLINIKELDEEIISAKTDIYIFMGETFHSARNIINKYGVVPINIMKDASPKYNFFIALELLKDKVKGDALVLLKDGINKDEVKEKLLKEAYNFLCVIMGTPPTHFKFLNHEVTPLEFKNLIIKSDLQEFVSLTTLNPKVFMRSNSFIPSIYLDDNEEIKQVSINTMKEAVVSQLKDGLAIWFSAEESTAMDYEYNILSPNVYRFNELLNIKKPKKNNLVRMKIYEYDHAMSITGAYIKKNEVLQFKVDNSFGKHGIYKGHCIMTNDFFENCIFTVVVNKKYLKEIK